MGVLVHTSNFQNSLKNKNKIPDYARDYRNEYLFIRGINKTCENFLKKIGREEIFKSPQAVSLMRYLNRFLKAQKIEYLNDTSEIKLKYKDVKSTDILKLSLDDLKDVFKNDEKNYSGFNKFFECFSRFMVKINVDEISEYEYYASLNFDDSDDEIDNRYSDGDSDSDDESGFNSDEFEGINSDEYQNQVYELLYDILNV